MMLLEMISLVFLLLLLFTPSPSDADRMLARVTHEARFVIQEKQMYYYYDPYTERPFGNMKVPLVNEGEQTLLFHLLGDWSKEGFEKLERKAMEGSFIGTTLLGDHFLGTTKIGNLVNPGADLTPNSDPKNYDYHSFITSHSGKYQGFIIFESFRDYVGYGKILLGKLAKENDSFVTNTVYKMELEYEIKNCTVTQLAPEAMWDMEIPKK